MMLHNLEGGLLQFILHSSAKPVDVRGTPDEPAAMGGT
jgi:hypothetical protein